MKRLRLLPKAKSYFKLRITLKKLDAIAVECSDNYVGQRLNDAREKPFQLVNETQNVPPELYLTSSTAWFHALDWKHPPSGFYAIIQLCRISCLN